MTNFSLAEDLAQVSRAIRAVATTKQIGIMKQYQHTSGYVTLQFLLTACELSRLKQIAAVSRP